MDKTKKKNFRMPSGIRNKLMGAVAMLLVSSIMTVSTTYAWFTLSTAPEVTGITTSVGANGNLEMALLNTDTYRNVTSITSGVGNSMLATSDATKSNVTWGNLVDLSDESYGLGKINLLPARLHILDGKTSNNGPLKTPVYGADGRVASVNGNTYTTVYDNNGWGFDSEHLTYGVRGIGANDNLTPQQAGLIAAKAAYNANLNSAKAAIQSALSTNGSALASAITTLAMNSTDVTLTENQQTAITAMVTASETALRSIDAAYKQVLLAAASRIEIAATYETVVAAINSAADFDAAKTQLTSNGGTLPDALTTAAGTLTTQKAAVAAAKTAITPASEGASVPAENYKTALNALVNTTKVTVNGYKVGTPVGEETYDNYLMGADGQINSTFFNKVISDGGAIVAMPDGSGVFAYVGKVAGSYSASCVVSINYKGLTLNNMNATMKTTATLDATVTNALNLIQASATSTGATALSDLYGYALDFAFRTNASGSKLQLQTAPKNRVYQEENSNAALQGSGSNMTFTSALSEAGAAVLTDTQVQTLMGAIRVAFINPDTGDIYGIAGLTNFAVTGDGVKGELVLMNWEVNAQGVLVLTAKPSGDGVDTSANDDIMELQQNTATKLTVIVWLDGDYVDNGKVANAAQSLSGSMNLQFSSSADLVPMQNSALKNSKP